MNNAKGIVFKFGDNVDTDVIIPARYLNSSDPAELATHCMEDIDKDFIKNVKKGDIIVAEKNFGCGSSRELPGTGIPRVHAEDHCRRGIDQLYQQPKIETAFKLTKIPPCYRFRNTGRYF